ncbi:MAG: methionine--tRNA ligase [Phycisphaeraceae bacterium]|nr:MAG: methionine--tRNA ligase [Phycisphaeraceae bacterium]
MTEPQQRYYITTPIYYVNDRPHIGHCYTTLVADVAARFMRLSGRDVFLLTGTDEHAERVVEAAAERGLTPIQWADRNAGAFEDAFRLLGFSNDDFIRTTQKRHTEKVESYIRRLNDSGDVYLGDYQGWWDHTQEEYVPENTAREHDFKSPITGKPLERRQEKNYFFRLSAYQDRLLKHIESNPGFIRPESRRNEVLGRIRTGLQDVPVSRAVDPDDPKSGWGILMPGDESHRIYVWIDALFNYLSAVDTDDRRKYWPAQAHVIGKDILWFHAVIWPCMLMALGEKLPGCIYAHSFWIREGRKMSKSLGNFIDMPTLTAYIDRYGLDATRWFLATQGPMGATDADFAHAKFIEVYNADLANGLGNAASRVSNMIAKYFDGACPDPTRWHGSPSRGEHAGHDWPAIATSAVENAMTRFEALDIPGALEAAVALARRVDGYIHATEPFKLAKDPEKLPEVGAILYHAAEALRIASLLMWAAIPAKVEDLQRRFGCEFNPGAAPLRDLAAWGGLTPGAHIEKGDALFPRADGEEAPPEPARAETS